MNKKKKRIWQFDLIRAIAIILMVIYHIFFIIDFYNIKNINLDSPYLIFIAYFSKLSFLFLVGFFIGFSSLRISNHLSFLKKQLLRSLNIGFFAALVSFFTYIFLDEAFIRFGILHLISSAILIYSLTVKNNFLILTIILTSLFSWIFLNDIFSEYNYFYYALGISGENPYSIDYFALFPWLAIIGFSVLIGKYFSFINISKNNKEPLVLSLFTFLGRHSLFIYLIHVPAIVSMLFLMGFLNFVL